MSNEIENDIFLQASRLRLRFPSAVGPLTIEDLWDLPLTSNSPNKASLENVGAELLARQAKFQSGSILRSSSSRSKEQSEVDLAVAVIRKVAQIRQDESEAKSLAFAKRQERERLEALIAEREGKEAPLDELKARLAALDR